MLARGMQYSTHQWSLSPIKEMKILQIPLSTSQLSDKFISGANKQWSVNSEHKSLKDRSEVLQKQSCHGPNYGISKLSHVISPMWRILHNRLLVKFSLFKKGINFSALCAFRDQQNESINNLFQWVGWTRGCVWIEACD